MKRFLLSSLCLLIIAGLSAQIRVYTPALSSPANNSVKQMPDITVHWNAITGSLNLRYQVQLDTVATFNSPLLKDTTLVLLTGYKNRQLLFNKTYYWRVRAIDSGSTSFWSEVWNFTIFDLVELYQPLDNDAGKVSPDTTLQWKTTVNKIDISGVTRYEYQIDTSLLFNSSILIQGSTNSIPDATTPTAYKSVKPVNLRFGAKYYWRVRAAHNLGHSDYCTPYSFTVIDNFTLSDPSNGATKVFKNATLDWVKVTGLLAYSYQIALDQNFTQVIESSETSNPTIEASFLNFGVTYYWRVRGRHATDTSSWSTPWSFTVINTVLLDSPSNNQQNVSLTPVLTWETQTGILGYNLEFDGDGTFTNPIISVKPGPTDSQYPIPAAKRLTPEKTYYWRMRAIADGTLTADTTDWSPTWSFKTMKATGLDEISMNGISIYPNPATDRIFLRVNVKDVSSIRFVLIDLVGKEVMSQEIPVTSGLNVKEIGIGGMPKGIYIGRITIGEDVQNQKIIINK